MGFGEKKEMGFKEGDCPETGLDVEFLIDWFSCDKGKSVLESSQLEQVTITAETNMR